MTSTLPGSPSGSGTIAVRPLPRSTPPSTHWPGRDDQLSSWSTGAIPDQPPLPWDDTPASTLSGPGLSGPVRTDHYGIRTLTFGDSWTEPRDDGLPDPAAWSARLVTALVEALHRRRPLSQLSRVVDEPTLTRLAAQVRRRPWGGQSVIRCLHLHRITPRSVEACAALRRSDDRATAIAFRLEAAGTRWLCTEVVTPPLLRRR